MSKILQNRYSGWMKATILCINPDKNELEALLGEEVLDIPEYTYEKNNGTRCARIDVYIQDIKTDTLFKHTLFIEDRDEEFKSKTKEAIIKSFENREPLKGENHHWFGKNHSEEFKKNLSKIRKKKFQEGYRNPRSRQVINDLTGIIYDNAILAATELFPHLNYEYFRMMLRGTKKNYTNCRYLDGKIIKYE